jgi:TusA-related sulfurtransferase/peroxiredoxin family protein
MSSLQENPTLEPTLLDWRGLTGPEAIVNTAKAVKRLDGRPSVLRILADDHAFPTDLASWCRVTRSQLLDLEQDPSGAFAALVRVNAARDATRPVERYEMPGQHAASGNLDCRGMLCPEPILALARTIRGLPSGSAIEVLADDPAFPMDVQGWCRSTGAILDSLDESGGVYRAVIRGRARTASRPSGTVPGDESAEVDTLLDGVALPAQPTQPAQRPATPTEPAAPVGALDEPRPGTTASNGIRVDLGGLPPEELAAVLDSLSKVSVEGTHVTVTGVHKHFARHVVDWCARGGHALVQLETSSAPMMALVRLRQGAARPESAAAALVPAGSVAIAEGQNCAILLLRNDMDAVLAALLTATTAASTGMRTSILFALFGINVVRGDRPRRDVPREKVSLVQRALKLMMPRGPKRQRLSKLSFAGAGGLLVRFLMKRRRLLLIEDLMQQACALDVRFVVCTMSMSVMGVTRRDLMDLPNIELGGIAAFVADARSAGIDLVF